VGGGSATGGGAATGGGGSASGGGAATGGGGASFDAGLPAGTYTRTLPAWPKRSYDVEVPGGYDGGTGYPLLLVLHGGGGNRAAAKKLACPGGVVTSPDCLDAMALTRGFVVVMPDGTGAALVPDARTWNSGGGANGWQCVSGNACNTNVDELGYFTELFADLSSVVPVDLTHVYSTGISNGASMSERLACQFPSNVRAIAPVAGGNQYSTTQSCAVTTSVLEIHGSADPCWPYDGGAMSCLDTNPGAKISVDATLAVWSANDGCDGGFTETMLPDTMADGTTTIHRVFSCGNAVLELYRVADGGHTWPGGYHYSQMVGLTSEDWQANPVILDFFQAH
jgi:polyhydroxybutyrate depolymerase